MSSAASPLRAWRSPSWAKTLRRLPTEGFYTLPDTLEFPGGARWVKNAIVELGYNAEGKGILFVGEWREDGTENALYFSDRGMLIEDKLLDRLTWAPILPTRNNTNA